jgi:hypothetical protein
VVGIVAAVVVLAVLGVVLLGKGGPGLGGTAGSVAYSEAVSAANQQANSIAGGPWTLVAVAGVDLAQASEAASNGSLGSGCTYTSTGGGIVSTALFVPGFHGSLSSGVAPFWGMIYYQNVSHEVLIVDVQNGSAHALVIASGSCTTYFGALTAIEGSLVDSSVAAANSWGQGGSDFVAQYPNVAFNLEMGLLGGGKACGLAAGPCWLIQYTPCNPLSASGPSGSQPTFAALLNATTGHVVVMSSSTTTCGSGVPLSPGVLIGSVALDPGSVGVGWSGNVARAQPPATLSRVS